MSKTEKKKKSSLDYPHLARAALEAAKDVSENGIISKLPASLYLVATPIGNLGDITLRALVTLAACDIIACEDTRNSGLLLQKYGIKKPLISYHDHNADEQRPYIIGLLRQGSSVALISDAGLPLIADPGFKLARGVIETGLTVTVIPGASAGLTALASSGLPTDAFFFAGFLPAKTAARRTALEEYKSIPATILFYEAPQRLAASLADLLEIFGSRQAAVSRELTKLFEETKRGSLEELTHYYAAHPPKGEIVIAVSPPEKAAALEGNPDEILRELLRTMSLRDAVVAACDATGLKKSEVYARALWLSGKGAN